MAETFCGWRIIGTLRNCFGIYVGDTGINEGNIFWGNLPNGVLVSFGVTAEKFTMFFYDISKEESERIIKKFEGIDTNQGWQEKIFYLSCNRDVL